MAADRSSSSSQIEKAPSTTTIAPSSTPNTGAAGLTVPAPMAPSQLPVSVMNRCAFSAALWLMAVDIQSLESIRICARAGPTAENAQRFMTDTGTSRIGSEITTASASITRYCEPNQLALTTLGLVLPLISPPTFWRNHWPAADTAAVKLRSALSPAADTTPVAAPLRALPTERPAPAPASQIWRAIGVCTPAHLSVCWVLCCGVVVVVGACWASAAGATTSTDRRARPITSRSQRPRERSRSWSIVIILELLKLVDEVRGRGRRVAVGDGDRPVRDGGAGLLPILVDPLELHGGHAPGFLGRQARVLVAAHAGLPDGDAGVGAVVGVEAVADGDGLEDDLAGDYLGQRLVGVVDSEEGGGDQLRLVLQVAPEPLARLRGRDRVDGGAPPGGVEHQLAGGERRGVVGGGADGARLGMVPTDGHAVDGPPAPHLLAVDGQRARRRHGGRRRALRRRGARGGRRRLWRRGAALRRGGLLWRRAGPAADQQPTGEQREGEREQAEQTEPTRGPGAALLGQAVDHPCPALLTYGHRHHLPSTGPATASGGASTSHHAILLPGQGPRSTGTPLLVPRTPPGPGRTARPPLGGAGWCSCGLRWSGPARTPS